MAVQRLQKELRLLAKDPLPSITARPDVKNILVWHYVLEGDAASEYAGGVYHGKITFPSQYPFRPPAIVMVTPSGRFQSNTRLCLSMSDYHPESWNPSWSVASILTGLQSFFYENTATTGSVSCSARERRALAAASAAFNEKNPAFRKVFPDLILGRGGSGNDIVERRGGKARRRRRRVSGTTRGDSARAPRFFCPSSSRSSSPSPRSSSRDHDASAARDTYVY